MPKIQNQIKFYKYITNAGVFASALLTLLTLNILIPINFKSETAVATDALTSTTSLTLDVASSTAGVELLVTSDSGTFASTASGNEMSFNVTTNNVTGYMLSISAKSGTDLANSTAGTKFTSLGTTDGVDSATFDTTTYNNMWGFKPNYYKSAANSDKFYPSPTTSGVTLNKTDSANVSGSYDTYTIAIGARATYAQVAGTYSNTYILSAVGNYPEYKITYNDASGESSDLPNTQEATSEANDKTVINFSDITPTRDGYEFVGWCSIDNSADPTSCSGATYDPGDEYALSTLSSNTVPLYAIWKKSMLAMQNLSYDMCATTAMEVYDVRDNQIYTVQKLDDGNCWLLDNLRLGAVELVQNLSTSNTNMDPGTDFVLSADGGGVLTTQASGYTTPDYNTSLWDSEETYEGIKMKYGVYYNYCAASAGTVCSNTKFTENAKYDICPAGWRMPTSNYGGEYNILYNISKYNSYSTYRVALRLPLSGGYRNGGPYEQGVYNNYWSSTIKGLAGWAYILSLGTSWVNGTAANPNAYGYTMRCVMKRNIENVSYLQQVEPYAVEKMAVGDTATLKDSRDGQEYTVGKLADGNLWLLDNSRLGSDTAMSLTSIDTNVKPGTTFTLPASGFTCFNDTACTGTSGATGTGYTVPALNITKIGTTDEYGTATDMSYGVYYNYCAVTAGSICASTNADDATYDICPKGWRLPASSEYSTVSAGSEYDTYDKLRVALRLPLSGGLYYSSSFMHQQSLGIFWSSTAYGNNTDMYSLIIKSSNSAIEVSRMSRCYATPARCVFNL